MFGKALPSRLPEPAYHLLHLILRLGRSVTVTEAYQHLGGSRPAWSGHLRTLEDYGFIDRQGRQRYDTAVINHSASSMMVLLRGDPVPYGRPKDSGPKSVGLAPDGGTRYKATVKTPEVGTPVLQPGRNNAKLGHMITKGPYKDYTLFSLTLEEGPTCPPCDLEDICYGGNMPSARRWEHGPMLRRALMAQFRKLPTKSMIRLHVLGDFYSADYARFWAEECPFPVFGYTHHPEGSKVREALAQRPWETMAIRTSWRAGIGDRNAVRSRGAVTIFEDQQAEKYDAIICPAQTGGTDTCATCGLCWHTDRNIAFKAH